MIMSATVERAYCRGPLDPLDTTFLVQETIDFAAQFNPLFEARPTWLVQATCLHAHYSWILYMAILFTSLGSLWHRRPLQTWILLGIGAKLYAVVFYHYMEFTSDMPPPNLWAYFGAEGVYMVSIALVLYKIMVVGSLSSASSTATTNGHSKTL